MREAFNQKLFEFIGDVQQLAYEISSDFQPDGINDLEYSILEHLYHVELRTVQDVSKTLLITVGRSRQHLKMLEEKKFVVKKRDEQDKRRFVYSITRKGKAKLDECFFQVVKCVRDKYAHLEEDVLGNIVECIEYMRKHLSL